MSKSGKTNITLSVDTGLYEEARKTAKQERRSLSAQVELWIERGLNPKDPTGVAARAAGRDVAATKGVEA